MAKSYYKTIQGVRYDRSLLEAAEERISGQGDGRISEMDAEEIVELSKDGKGITETELRTLKYISENYHFTPKAAVWFAGILTDTEQAVDYDQFEQTQSRTQKLPELDQASSPLPEHDLSTLTTPQSGKFTLVEEPIERIPHLIWGALLFVAILVGAVLYQGAIKEIETLELKLSVVPSILELEQQISDLKSDRSALQTIVSELKQKVAKTNSDQMQFQKGLSAEQDKLASKSSEITNLRSEVQALQSERSTLLIIVSELKQKVAETNSVQAQFQKGLPAEQDKVASENSEITKLRSVPTIGVFDFIISRTDFKVAKCEAYSCNFVSTDNAIKMDLKRATLEQHVSKDLKFLLNIELDSKLFKSGLLVQYYNNKNLIRVYLKGAAMTIETTRNDEIEHLQAWLQKVMQLCATSGGNCKP
jgi:DNA repair exonuclease SbcCD ATPase subunit